MVYKYIMVVDNSKVMHKAYEVTIRSLVSKGLVDENYKLTPVNDGEEALKLIAESEDLDLLIWEMDLMHINAVDMLEQLPQITNNKPTLLITDNGSPLDDINHVLKLGAHATLNKPFNSEDLHETLVNI